MKTGIELIAEERKRQVSKEGWTASHDDKHRRGQMAWEAACYAANSTGGNLEHHWPSAQKWWKPSDLVRSLVKAGALIAAEIDRLNRRPHHTESTEGESHE